MSKKKTTAEKKYILIDELNDNVLIIGTLKELQAEIELFINDEDDADNLSVYEVGKKLSVSVQSSGWDVFIEDDF